MINALNSAVSGLVTQSTKISVGALNISNADVEGSTDPQAMRQAYQARDVEAISTTHDSVTGSVRPEVRIREPATTIAYDPTSQYADDEGFVNVPNVSLTQETTNNIVASQAYKANAQIISVVQDMNEALLDAVDTKA